MKKLTWQLFRYYRQVKSFLPCSYKSKKRCLHDLKVDVAGFLEQNPQADFSDIQDRFVTPHEISAAFVDEMNTTQLLKQLRIRRRILVIVACVALLVVVGHAALYSYGVKKINDTFGGYFVVQIEEIDEYESDLVED